MYLTVIIPAYNEETRLPDAIREVVSYLAQQDYTSEVIVVENGSTDRTTEVAIKHLIEQCAHHNNVIGRLLHSTPGKGAAVRLGLQHARGNWSYMCDVDLSTPIGELDRFLTVSSVPIVIGARYVREDDPIYRRAMAVVFGALARGLVPYVDDTQSGFKLFHTPSVRELLDYCVVDGWAFDVELLHIAHLRGYGVYELAVPWRYGEHSKINPVRDAARMMRELLGIWLRSRRGEYDEAVTGRVSARV